MAGYSSTPLSRKLGIAEGIRLLPLSAPPNYRELLEPLPSGTRLVRAVSERTDIVHLFVTRRARLQSALEKLRRSIRPDATVWVSWPKRAAGVETDDTEDVIRQVALPLGLVDVKVCAVDDTWSVLKLVIRRSERERASR
jgi:hypothetical protein